MLVEIRYLGENNENYVCPKLFLYFSHCPNPFIYGKIRLLSFKEDSL